ncbi:TetR/AcrR family transcriptional regulator [Flexivirga caeni]|uniref:TetR/AcrR family transcriptional regulator n=1 Tax=Flexivirga caeni TaxID=2294115 RepID=UPI001C660BA4|nr:TetR/AcrR family transcriptional regulator [Flexivirga caeni]
MPPRPDASSGNADDAAQAPRRGRGRPAVLSRERIVAAALESNLDTLTVRELATKLGVRHGALYHWVADRDELLDLVSQVIVDRVLPADDPRPEQWRDWLRRLAWSAHDEFLAVPGYATRTSQPHRHNQESFGRMRTQVIKAFTAAGASPEMAEQSFYIFATSLFSCLSAIENSVDLGGSDVRYDVFLETLLRGLPARDEVPGRPASNRSWAGSSAARSSAAGPSGRQSPKASRSATSGSAGS